MLAISSDHAGYQLKKIIINWLEANGYAVTDFGTNSEQSCDYPDFACLAAKAVTSNKCKFGIVICGTGIGMSIAANKVKGIRCALCTNVFMAQATRNHNDANFLALGSRVTDSDTAIEIVKTFLTSDFEGGRHIKRIEKIKHIEGDI